MAKSFRSKLWIWFAVFAAVILSLLWILQTVFLQRFYNSMMIGNIRSAAEEIIKNSENEDLDDLIDELSVEDSLLVYITDEDGDVLYSSDAYNTYFRQMPRQGMGKDRNEPRRRPEEKGGFRSLPDNYERFLSELKKSETGEVGFTYDGHYIYGSYLKLDDDDPAILYVSGSLGAVGAAASIIRIQLIWVTALSLVLAFVIAWLIAKRFAGPINRLSVQAQMLGSEDYEDHFEKGFCRELDELDEAMAQSAAKLAEARDYQKELLANVSHDLRTPLTMIRGYAEMVRDVSWEDEAQRNADTGVIIKEADRLTALVNEILEYSRLREKNYKAALLEVDLSELTENVLDRFEPLFSQEGGTIEREITPGCIVLGDRELLERAIYNLLDNATRHTSETEKRITVTVRGGDRICLEVRDYGEGIDPEELPHIWEKYYTNRQRGSKGVSGLGLAIVKQIASIHRAEVTAESKPGEGSKFSLILDRAD
ncbi:MAG: HAMP domain-containing histidine kinase [Flexilinea sp.]|nr:HAMP domain-containing histidine kinase [Flexilinea sp.]